LNTLSSFSDKNTKIVKDVAQNHSPVTILNLISNKQVSKILVSTFKVPKSVQTLSRVNDIPIAACYRKVRLLEKLGFLGCVESRLNQNGKRVKYYQCQIISGQGYSCHQVWWTITDAVLPHLMIA
jgi:hypothetical protein